MPSRYEEDRLSDRLSAPFMLPIAPKYSPYDNPTPRMPDEEDALGRKAYVASVYGSLIADRPEVQKTITDQYEYNKKRVLSGKAPLHPTQPLARVHAGWRDRSRPVLRG